MKKNVLLLLSAAVAAALLTGCQSGGSNPYSKYVTLGEYKGLSIDRPVTEVTEDDVQYEIQNRLYNEAEMNEITDRPAKNTDIVNIDFEGTIDGEPFDGGTEEGYEIELGTDTFIEGFEENVIGMSIGDTKEFDVTFPDSYDGVLDGQTATFKVTLNSITEMIVPEYNEDFLSTYTDYSTKEEFEAAIKEELQQMSEDDADYAACTDALAQAVENATFSGYPEDMYNSCKEQMESENQAFAEMFGLDVEDLYDEDYDIDSIVLETINQQMVVYTIAAKEKISVSDEDYDAFVSSNFAMYGYESADDFKADYPAETMEYDLLYEKILDFFKENSNFTDVVTDDFYYEDPEALEDVDDIDEEDEFLEIDGEDPGEEDTASLFDDFDAEEEETGETQIETNPEE